MTGGNELVETWRRIIAGDAKSWVLFEHGTCVVVTKPTKDLAAAATKILAKYGPVQVGSPSADFNVVVLSALPGWVVTGHHPDVLNFVAREDGETEHAPSGSSAT